MAKRKLLMTLAVAAVLAVPAGPALAGGHGDDGHEGHHHGRLHGRHHHSRGGGKHGHGLRQLEGTVVSVAPDGGSMVLQPMGSEAMTVTVAISSSTVVTADEGMTATLAAGEQVHVAASVGADGTYTAVRVMIQRSEPQAAETPEADTGDGGADTAPTPSSD